MGSSHWGLQIFYRMTLINTVLLIACMRSWFMQCGATSVIFLRVLGLVFFVLLPPFLMLTRAWEKAHVNNWGRARTSENDVAFLLSVGPIMVGLLQLGVVVLLMVLSWSLFFGDQSAHLLCRRML